MHPPTPKTYTLSLHDALPICGQRAPARWGYGYIIQIAEADDERGCAERPNLAPRAGLSERARQLRVQRLPPLDRKSTRLNSSHVEISYAVFCLKKKNKTTKYK